MDFFAEQRTRTRRSLLLYGLFLLIVLAHMAVALGIMALLLTVFTGGIYHWVLVLVIIWTLFSFIIGSFLEYRRLKAGGRAIAQRVGAIRLFIDNSHDAWEHSQGIAHQHESLMPVRYTSRHIAVRHERDFPAVYRRYYEFAQQLAIASGLTMPILYVLPNEQGINGFVAGRHSNDMVMVVTQGALDKLSDEALYGLIGHEYGHILHGDAKFNLQLMVVLAGLQLLYDWSNSINNFSAQGTSRHTSYFDDAVNQTMPLSQREVDARARSTEAQTANFTSHSEWVTYWQSQSQSQFQIQHRALSTHSLSLLTSSSAEPDRSSPRNIWTLIVHAFSFSSMASAQLIKHSFNRERELLADATSIQLTRSPAILETLKAIHQDPLGSRLSDTTDINGLSHFFFASSGADLGDVSWFATHPSLSERMSAINANAYQDFAVQVAQQKRLNQQKIKEIYEQRRLGDWSERYASINLNNFPINNNTKADAEQVISPDNNTLAEPAGLTQPEDNEEGLSFKQEVDVIIDGRLQVNIAADKDMIAQELLKPWQALPDNDLPADKLVELADIQQVSLPHYLLNHSHHPLGALALIEAVMLCHQDHALSTATTYSLTDIWCGLAQSGAAAENSDNNLVANLHHLILPHTIDAKLLEIVATLDRRLDSSLIAIALNQLRKQDLSLLTIEQLQQQSLMSHRFQDQQHYEQQQKCRAMLLRYQQGFIKLFNHQLTADLTSSQPCCQHSMTDIQSEIAPTKNKTLSIISLWQALHLQQLLPVLSQVLGSNNGADNKGHDNKKNADKENADKKNDNKPISDRAYSAVLQARLPDSIAQLDPSGNIFAGLSTGKRTMLIVFAYRLAKDAVLKNKRQDQIKAYLSNHNICYVTDLRRHARLIDIDLSVVKDADLQWLLLTAQRLNSIQLFAIIDTIAAYTPEPRTTASTADNSHNNRPTSSQIAYNTHRLWLSTLHTVMLHDTIISQDEYDCLTLLAEHWLGVRQLCD
ncbi:peptidase M48 [Psychrobacter urativorans]|uniref:Peptidase M48 n=1 Tax=Psychrobacter urativorans TaxID=45610 RepID=A0A0M4TGN2_9GAMM|nr:peptidase M48 [Psychrobacter urativorans]